MRIRPEHEGGIYMNRVRKSDYGIQAATIFGIFSLFAISAIYSRITSLQIYPGKFLICTFISFFAFGMSFVSVVRNWQGLMKRFADYFQNNKIFFICLVPFVVLRLLQYDVLPRWDSSTYFSALGNACKNFDFTLGQFVNLFNLASHSCYGYSLFLAIGYYLFPESTFGVYTVNLILSAFAFYYTYEILKSFLPDVRHSLIAFGTFVIWSMPMTLGTFASVNLDYGVMLFLIYVMYFHLRRKYLLLLFYAFILVQTKEVAILCLAAYGAAYCLCRFASQRGSFSVRLKAVFWDTTTLVLLSAGFFALANRVLVSFLGARSWGNIGNVSGYHNVFSFNISYIILKLKTFFLLNFYWIFVLIILIFLIVLLIRKKSSFFKAIIHNEALFCGWFAALGFIIFSCLYLTYNNARYNLYVEYILALTGILFLLWACKGPAIPSIIMGFCSILVLLQSYISIDPVTKYIFPEVDTGSDISMVSTGWQEYPSLQADISVYNYQYTYLDKAYDEMLRQVQYHDGLDLILWGQYDPGVRAVSLEGMRSEYYWDQSKQQRVVQQSESTCSIKPIFQQNFYGMYESGALNDEAIFIFSSHFLDNEASALEELSQFYTIDEGHTVEIWPLGAVTYYHMILK